MNARADFPSAMDLDQADRDASWLAHLRKRRAARIEAYLTTHYGTIRREARADALRYGAMIRRWINITGATA